jgi:hypothetical protein
VTLIRSFTTPITSQSINSPIAVQEKILEQYRIHWFLGLRQSELFLSDRSGALEHAQYALQKSRIQIERIELEIKELENCKDALDDQESTTKTRLILDIEEKRLEINEIKRGFDQSEYQIRDAMAEFRTAESLRSSILKQHSSEISNMNYSDLHAIFGRECFNALRLNVLCKQILALEVGESIAEMISSVNPNELDTLLETAKNRLSNDFQSLALSSFTEKNQ